MNILNHIINVIFPAACKQCGGHISANTPTAYFCNGCWGSIKWFAGPCCPGCGIPYPSIEEKVETGTPAGHLCGACHMTPPWFDRAVSGGPYDGALAEAIKLFKYKKKIHIGRALVEQMISLPSTLSLSPLRGEGNTQNSLSLRGEGQGEGGFSDENSPSCLIPVPLHPKRLREREFNQSAIIASELGKRLEMPVLLDVLIRSRHTKPQVELDVKERRTNVVGAFAIRDTELVKDKDIILIDDVYTTGFTVNECAKVLKKNEAKRVYVVTIARMIG